METKTRLIWIILSLGVLATLSLVLILGIYKNNPRDPLSAVPSTAQAVVLVRGTYLFGSSTPLEATMAAALKTWPRFTRSIEALLFLDSLYRNHPGRFDDLKNTKLVITAVPIAGKTHALIIADAVSGTSQRKWKAILESWGHSLPPSGQPSDLSYEKDGFKIQASFSHNLLLISSSRAAINLAKETLNRPFKSDFLNQALTTAGSKVAATLFLPDALIDSILLLPFPAIRDAVALDKPNSGWISLDITLKAEDALLTGYISTEAGKKSWLQWIASSPDEGKLPENIPRDALAFIHFSSITSTDSLDFITPESTDTLGEFSMDPVRSSWNLSLIHLPNLTSKSGEALMLRMPHPPLAVNDSIPLSEYLGNKVQLPPGLLHLPLRQDPSLILGTYDSAFLDQAFFAIQGGRKLSSASWFEDFTLNLPDIAGCWGRINLVDESPWLEVFRGGKIDQAENTTGIVSLDWAVRAGHSPFITLHVSSRESTTTRRKSFTAPSTDAPLALPPTPVWDHNNKVYNLLCFDQEGTAYLFSPLGETLWRREMKSNPMGIPETVDLFKNGKIQYIFNTKDQLFAIDLNGNDVEGFPVTLPVMATNAVSVIAYDHKRDYRFLLAVKGRKVFNYTSQGHKTPGWTEPKMRHDVTERIHYLSLGGKDFIIIPDEGGEVLMTGRRGETRINIRRSFKNAPGTAFYPYTRHKEKRMLTTDNEGHIQILTTAGKLSSMPTDKFTPQHRTALGERIDTRETILVIADEKWLRVYNLEGQKIFETSHHEIHITDPVIIPLAHKTLIALCGKESNMISIWQIGVNETVMEVPGAFKPVWVDLDQDGEFELISGFGKDILFYRLD